VQKGAKISYEGKEAVTQPTTCAIIPCGYADFVHFGCSGVGKVLIDGKLCKILGRVCMDTIIVDATGIPDPVGKTAVIIDNRKGLTLMDIARTANTVVCDLLCSFNFARSEVIYKK